MANTEERRECSSKALPSNFRSHFSASNNFAVSLTFLGDHEVYEEEKQYIKDYEYPKIKPIGMFRQRNGWFCIFRQLFAVLWLRRGGCSCAHLYFFDSGEFSSSSSGNPARCIPYDVMLPSTGETTYYLNNSNPVRQTRRVEESQHSPS